MQGFVVVVESLASEQALHLTRSRRQNGAIKDAFLAPNPELYCKGWGETPHSIRDHVRFPGFPQAGGEMSAFVDKAKRG